MLVRIIVLATVVLCANMALSAEPYGLDSRANIGPFLDGKMPDLGPGISGNWSAVVAFPNLNFHNTVGLLPMPGTKQLFVWEREGRIWSFENKPGVAEKKLVLDISPQCQGWDDSGLLGLAFHPDFVKNHYFYCWYAWVKSGTVLGDSNNRPPTDTPNHDRLSRFTVGPDGKIVPGSEFVLIDQETHVVWHKGGGMFFHPKDGFLYLTIGDDEDGSNSQRIDLNLLGGLLRIDVDQRGGTISHPIPHQPANGHTTGYSIPNSNPFVGKPGVLEEFYGIGLRSPHRMTHDAVTGRTFIGDVGDATREEIDIIEPTDPPGLNFQWPIVEGLQGDLTPPYLGVNKRPVMDYNHGEGSAIIGGFVYRGKKWADDLGGRYIFGDNGTGKIWALDERLTPVGKTQLCLIPFAPGPNFGGYNGLASFGVDADNELYMCQMSSVSAQIYRLERTGPPPVRKPFPKLLSQTGAFTDTAKLIPAPGLIPYTVNSPLWSDGAVKSRWMALPSGQKITAPAKGDWDFPAGTVFVKQFDLPVDERNPQVHRRLETRLLVRDATGSAYGLTYKWRADNSDADLLADSVAEDITIHTADGGTRTQKWYYPSQTDCMRCHTPAANFVLGPKTRQLNGSMLYAASNHTDNQLRTWNHLDVLDPAIDEQQIATLDKSSALTDASAPEEVRVRSYLDSNCAHCHRPGGVHTLWDARFDTALLDMNVINKAPINHLGPAGTKILKAGDLAHSLLLMRANSAEPLVQMPPVARNVIDQHAVDLISHWISTMPSIGELPKPWVDEDIGSGLPGDAMFVNGTFHISGSGSDIFDNADGFHFVHQKLTGDGTIIARVASIGDGDDWAKAGVMIRESNDPASRHAIMLISHTQGASLQHRGTPAGDSDHDPAPEPVVQAPAWIELQRQGKFFTGSISTDGVKWTTIKQIEIDMAKTTLVGLAVSSHNTGALVNTTFDHVSVK